MRWLEKRRLERRPFNHVRHMRVAGTDFAFRSANQTSSWRRGGFLYHKRKMHGFSSQLNSNTAAPAVYSFYHGICRPQPLAWKDWGHTMVAADEAEPNEGARI
jgi:hypothetical protein